MMMDLLFDYLLVFREQVAFGFQVTETGAGYNWSIQAVIEVV